MNHPEHTAAIIDGKAMAKALRGELAAEVTELNERGITPGLAVLLVGEDPASAIYVRNKARSCKRIGMLSQVDRLPADIDQDTLLAKIDAINDNPAIDGLLIQLPIPRHLDTNTVIERVVTAKDVDGFGIDNLGLLTSGRPELVACTPAGVMQMLERYGRESGFALEGKHAVVIGRSVTVGKPMALLLLAANCTVTICHSRTQDLAGHVGRADVVVAAVGVPELVQGSWLKPGAVVIDVGIHRREDGSLCGDVHYESARRVAAAISPVPGGVGPMTVAMLLANTVQACKLRRLGDEEPGQTGTKKGA